MLTEFETKVYVYWIDIFTKISSIIVFDKCIKYTHGIEFTKAINIICHFVILINFNDAQDIMAEFQLFELVLDLVFILINQRGKRMVIGLSN